MNTAAKLLIAAVVWTSLQGCAILEGTGDLAVGALSAIGETTMFIADTATFGTVSSITGSKSESWASTPSQSVKAYGSAATSYVAATNSRSSTPTMSSAATLTTTPSKNISTPAKSTYASVSGGGSNIASAPSSASTRDYDCKTREQELMAKMQRMLNQSNNGICQTARTSGPLFAEMATFYHNCRVLDPSGDLARTAEENARAMRETAKQACAN